MYKLLFLSALALLVSSASSTALYATDHQSDQEMTIDDNSAQSLKDNEKSVPDENDMDESSDDDDED